MKHAQKGFSLIEILVAMAMLGLISWAIITVWLGSQKAYNIAMALADAQGKARLAMVAMEQEIRAASKSSITASSSELVFEAILPNQTTLTSVRYYTASATINGSAVPVLYRESPAGSTNQRMIATYIDGFNTTFNLEEVQIQLTVAVKNKKATLSTEVRPRNP